MIYELAMLMFFLLAPIGLWLIVLRMLEEDDE